jgi:hypothetical protein
MTLFFFKRAHDQNLTEATSHAVTYSTYYYDTPKIFGLVQMCKSASDGNIDIMRYV